MANKKSKYVFNVDYGFISSDHLPMTVHFNFQHAQMSIKEEVNIAKNPYIRWDTLTEQDKQNYSNITEEHLKMIKLDHSLLLCDNPNCKDVSHIKAIDKMYGDLVASLQTSSQSFEQTCSKSKPDQIPGWNTYCKELHTEAREAFLLWRHSGSPRTGTSFELMRKTRAQFKRALRQCRSDKDRQSADALATKLLNKESKDFWTNVRRMCNSNIKMQATSVGGASGDKKVCDMWRDHFCGLLNSSTDTSNQDSVLNALNYIEDDYHPIFNYSNIALAIKKLKKGKAQGLDNLSSEHYLCK